MKLINKKTGEIEDVMIVESADEIIINILGHFKKKNVTRKYSSLAEFNEEWEDEDKLKPFEEVAKVGFVAYAGPGTSGIGEILIDGIKFGIADRDYYEILPDGTKKTEFTWDEAMEIEKKTNGKWRLPTAQELNAMVVSFGYNDEDVFDGDLFAKRLGLTTDEDGRGLFWSRTAASQPNARYLYFGGSLVYPQSYNYRVNGCTVRCVAQL